MSMKYKVFLNFFLIIVGLCIMFWSIIFLILGGVTDSNTEQLLWGLEISETKFFPEIIDLIIWGLVSGIPIFAVQILLDLEYSSRLYIVLPRYRNICKWHINNLIRFFIIIICWYFFGGLIAAYSNTKMLITALCLNILYSFSVVITLISVYLLFYNIRVIVLGYILISVVSLGFFSNNSFNKYVFGFWGMINRSNVVNNSYGFDITKVIVIMCLLSAFQIVLQCLFLKKRKIDKCEE